MAGGSTALSEAVVVFLKKFPGDNGAEFASRYRTAVDATRDAVRRILDEALNLQLDWSVLDLNGAGDLVELTMHERHPELSREALTAVGNYYTYVQK